MRRIPILLSFFVSVLFSTSCLNEKSSKVESSQITTDYMLHYDDSDRTVIGEVQFTTKKPSSDGSYSDTVYLELDNNSSVFFDDQYMVETRNFVDQITYQKIWTAQPLDKIWGAHTFRYVQNTGGELVNTASPISFPTAVFSATTVAKDSGFSVNWRTAEPIGNDTLQLKWNTYDHYPAYLLTEEKNFAPGTTVGTITVDVEKLHHWDPNRTYYAQLCRLRELRASQTPLAGGRLTLISCSARKPLTLN